MDTGGAYTGNTGYYTSHAVVAGNPAISYYDVDLGNLMYVRATDASGTAWGPPLAIDTVGNMGQWTCLKVVNGNPAISYYDSTNGDLRYVRAFDASGTAWGTPITPDVGPSLIANVGAFTSLKIVNGNPAMAIYTFATI